MSTTYTVGVRIDGTVAGYLRAVRQGETATRSFGRTAKAEFDKLRQFWSSYQGQLAGLGLGGGFLVAQRNAAVLQKTLTQVRLTAGMSAQEQEEAYRNMFALVRRNGGVMEETVGGFNNLIQAGLKYKEAMRATEAISIAKAVTGASENSLSSGLTVGAANFNFDLAKPGEATRMLDQMAVAGRLGNAELENLSDIFARVAQRAQTAGMGFKTTLAFIEGLSQIERQPERLATLADSTLRLFTNAHYAKDAEKATGVKFFNRDGSRREALATLEDMRKKYRALTTDAQRFQFVNKAFGKADLDTQRGLAALFSTDGLQNIREFEKAIENAGGTLARDLPTAVANAADQGSRLKNTLREAAENFARPINDSVSRMIKYTLDSKDAGGLGVSGGALVGSAGALALGGYAAARFLPPVLRGLVGRSGGIAAGVATGTALKAAGVTPVYVTNWAEMNGGGGLGGVAGAAGGAAGGAALARVLTLGRMAGGVGLAGAAGYGVGTGIYKFGLEGNAAGNVLGRGMANILSFFGNKGAGSSVRAEYELEKALKRAEFKGEVKLFVSAVPGLGIEAETKTTNPRIPFRTDVGRTNYGAGY